MSWPWRCHVHCLGKTNIYSHMQSSSERKDPLDYNHYYYYYYKTLNNPYMWMLFSNRRCVIDLVGYMWVYCWFWMVKISIFCLWCKEDRKSPISSFSLQLSPDLQLRRESHVHNKKTTTQAEEISRLCSSFKQQQGVLTTDLTRCRQVDWELTGTICLNTH